MTNVFFITNDWDDSTLDVSNQSWVNDGRCCFKTEQEAIGAIIHREMIAPDEKGRLTVLTYKA